MQLINAVVKILDGTIECPNLINFIWMTGVPFPLGRSEGTMSKRQIYRGYRYNPIIAAANEFYLKGIMNAKIKNHLKLTIIDSYSILHPRLGIEDEPECVCWSHYACRYTTNRGTQTFYHSRGGDAVIDSLLFALSST